MKKDQIRVLIADDEPLARAAIREYLGKIDSFSIIAECGDGRKALEDVKKLKPDLLLLDIEMPELSGIDLVAQLNSPMPHVVFITAFADYAVKAFEENAIDYILKPINEERFSKMIERVEASFDEKTPELDKDLLQQMLQLREKKKYLKKITSKSKGKIHFVSIEDIVWIQSAGAFSKIHLSAKIELVNFSIKQLEELLDPVQFVRVHKSHMINVEKIDSIESYFHGEYILTMKGGTAVKLSRGYRSGLDKILNQYN